MGQYDRRDELKDWAFDFAGTGAVGAFLGLLGPFGNFMNGPAWQRIPYWVGMAWLGTLVFGGAVRIVLARGWGVRTTWVAIAGVTVLISAPFAALSWWIATHLWPILATLPHLRPTVWYLQGLAIAAPQVALFTVLQNGRLRRATLGREKAAAGPAPAPGLLGARPQDVICLRMEDHYVRVHTAGGSRLVLATLAQAMAALEGVKGLQVHRSWWVAETAVEGAEAEGRNLRLRLKGGLTAPVARSSVAAVRAAGWLGRTDA